MAQTWDLGDEYANAYLDLLRSVARAQVTGLWPILGHAYERHRTLMVCGQATNGWQPESTFRYGVAAKDPDGVIEIDL